MTDGVHNNITLSFAIDEVSFQRNAAKTLNTSLQEFKEAMRVVVTSRFGFSVYTLQDDTRIMRQFANSLTIPDNYCACQLLVDLLCLLPNENASRLRVIEKLNDVVEGERISGNSRRTLAHYQSYFRFDHYLNVFWASATQDEKALYFPIYFWWKITAILPLRPTECVLTPRNCIRENNGKYYLTIRRTKVKGTKQGVQYNIAADFEKKEYPIPKTLGQAIVSYIAETEETYHSDIDVLFCKTMQFSKACVLNPNDHHYTYENLTQCLQHFYIHVLQKKFGLNILENAQQLGEQEIQKIRLGDTRHIAMVSLAVSGATPTICKELAGHDSIEISAHYFSNVKSFLDVLSYERFRADPAPTMTGVGLSCDRSVPVRNGYCQYANIKAGDYTPCQNAVDNNGNIGVCSVCEFFLPIGKYIYTMKSNAEDELKETYVLLKQAVDQLHVGMGNADTLSCVIDQLRAKARQYAQASILARKMTESEVFYE